jgi:hypothetical protein
MPLTNVKLLLYVSPMKFDVEKEKRKMENSFVKCSNCGTPLNIRHTTHSIKSTITKAKFESSKTSGKPLVVQVQPIDESEPLFLHTYTIFCKECEQTFISSDTLSEINDFLIRLVSNPVYCFEWRKGLYYE